MTRILVFYGSTQGQTAKIAEVLAAQMRARGTDVDLVDAAAHSPAPDDYAAVVVAASVHAGGYQRPVRRWVRTHAAARRNVRRHSSRCALACCSTTLRSIAS